MLAKLLKPFHFKIFFSSKYVHGMVLDKVTNVTVASVSSSSYAFEHYLGEKACKNNEKACELLGKLLADRVKAREVPSIYWDGIISKKSNKHKWDTQADAVWETMEDEGLTLWRDEPPSQKEMDDRKHEARVARKMSQKGKSQVSNIDPRFRQQMWKLMKKRPKKTSAAAPASEK